MTKNKLASYDYKDVMKQFKNRSIYEIYLSVNKEIYKGAKEHEEIQAGSNPEED